MLQGEGMWEEARQAFERGLQVHGISRENELAVKDEIGAIFREQVKMEEAPKLPKEIPMGDQRFQKSKNKEIKPKRKSAKKKIQPRVRRAKAG